MNTQEKGDNYSAYSSRELMDLYISVDKLHEPEKAKEIEEALRSKINSAPLSQEISSEGISWDKKNLWIPLIIGVLMIISIVMPYVYTPDISSIFIYSMITWGLIISIITILFYFASKGSIAAGVFLAIYLLYIMFASFIFK